MTDIGMDLEEYDQMRFNLSDFEIDMVHYGTDELRRLRPDDETKDFASCFVPWIDWVMNKSGYRGFSCKLVSLDILNVHYNVKTIEDLADFMHQLDGHIGDYMSREHKINMSAEDQISERVRQIEMELRELLDTINNYVRHL